MARVKGKDRKQKRLGIKAKIDLPTIKLEVKSNDAVESLKEIRKIIESVQRYPEATFYDVKESDFDDSVYYDVKFNQLSKDFNNNKHLIQTANALSDAFHESKVRKVSLTTLSEIDMQHQKVSRRLSMSRVKKAVASLLSNVEHSGINHMLVHVMGDIPKKDAEIIVDQLKKEVPSATIKSVFKNKKLLDKVSVEAVLFGDFGVDISDDKWDNNVF